MGVGASMLWWEEGSCRLLAAGGRFVIRYDHRDTGRSVTYEPGRPEYTGADLGGRCRRRPRRIRDRGRARRWRLGGWGVRAAARNRLPDRVLSLTLISTSPATAGERSLPAPTERFNAFLASAEVDWSERRSVIEYLVAYQRMLTGGARLFDEAARRELVRRDVERARDIAASQNHNLIPEGDVPSGPISLVAAPTLVIHGTADPIFRTHRRWPRRSRARNC
jgi:pimeloyl-ACP methyl ester carboxylesterase